MKKLKQSHGWTFMNHAAREWEPGSKTTQYGSGRKVLITTLHCPGMEGKSKIYESLVKCDRHLMQVNPDLDWTIQSLFKSSIQDLTSACCILLYIFFFVLWLHKVCISRRVPCFQQEKISLNVNRNIVCYFRF